MKHPLEELKDPIENLLLWIGRFLRYKCTSLSNSQVKDQNKVFECLNELNQACSSSQLEKVCKKARNAGLLGINTYALPLLKFYEYTKKISLKSLKSIDEVMLAEFLSVYTGGLSLATKKNYRIALLGLFSYIDKQNQDENEKSYIYNITLKNISGTNQSAGNKLPTHLNNEELEKFLEGIDKIEMSAKVRARNRLLIKIIVFTGMRSNEALQLKIKDFTLENGCYTILIKGKGDKYRAVMLKAFHIESLLKEWLIERELYPVKNDLLFCNQKGNALTQAYLYKQVERIINFAELRREKNGAHMLRHSFATLLYQKRHDLILVQEALGHASLNTSRIYTHFDQERLKEAASIWEEN
ncbi:integrase [Helicobacter pylori X47-2AL]|uniref:Tyrosine recombinase XerH n=1 Tax=Helicobacter pylori X47-2AL TaxID=1386083 RepID=V6LAK3_HELPX|nr:tyrosine recombinase XerH [Helicobacter pylori]EST41248.1 integrase [Helicobacter pylori X47-2AL]MUT42472.1 tyrosine-type recombinase/integrase [Helicobacter pylori]MUT74641.1 tyrosine-type recombinase/integrase [Helicobacter pylori]MUT82314.1 tyrosine-type recombinase/integrase [Helicobacter pylori]